MLRLEALRNQRIGGGQNAVEGHLGIESAPAPEHAVLQNAVKGRLFPVFLVYGHHVVVGHHHRRAAGGFAGPAQKQSPIRQLLKFTG